MLFLPRRYTFPSSLGGVEGVVVASWLKVPETQVLVTAERDEGVTSRVLDLLERQDRLPTTFSLSRREADLQLSFGVPAAGLCTADLVRRLRELPGVRSASAESS